MEESTEAAEGSMKDGFFAVVTADEVGGRKGAAVTVGPWGG